MGRNKINSNISSFDELLVPTIKAIQLLGGSGTNDGINGKVFEIVQIPNYIIEILQGNYGSRNGIDYSYYNSVTFEKIKDFRRAVQGRKDKDLLFTTATFTKETTKEASLAGPPPIDLIGGVLLYEKLKALKLGV